MRWTVRRFSGFVRAFGAAVDAGDAAKPEQPVQEHDRRRPTTPTLPWDGAGPAQAGRIYPPTGARPARR